MTDLAVLIPGLTYTGERFRTFLNSLKQQKLQNVHFYIDTWDSEYNDQSRLLELVCEANYEYTIHSEKYEDVFDDLIADFVYRRFPGLGYTLDRYFYRKSDAVDFRRRHFAIYYKFYTCYKMSKSEDFVLRTKSNINAVLNFDISKLQETLEHNDSTYNNVTGNNEFNREYGAASEITRSDNTVLCNIAGVNTAGQVKINENALFAHRRVFEQRLFGCYDNLEDFLQTGILPVYVDNAIKNTEAYETKVNANFPSPAVGSLVWGDFIRSKNIQIHSGLCVCGPQDRSNKVNHMY